MDLDFQAQLTESVSEIRFDKMNNHLRAAKSWPINVQTPQALGIDAFSGLSEVCLGEQLSVEGLLFLEARFNLPIS
ncbi:hypothetical protein L596_018787 [Steinernema carpocapsae]|uniref:Uncharacterized protein n=1 Tax=Steinernema carpocapsae TaxID=34508 RepID=A0A4U5N6S6_STECR|nr:hypothetical protein L596_018787 [Steinernema carpocapsae]